VVTHFLFFPAMAAARPTSFANLQPQWAGEEPVEANIDPRAFMEEHNKHSPAQNLITRGYAIVPMSEDTMKVYAHFYEALALFCNRSIEEKIQFAQVKNGILLQSNTTLVRALCFCRPFCA
jgi:hypothetical protein